MQDYGEKIHAEYILKAQRWVSNPAWGISESFLEEDLEGPGLNRAGEENDKCLEDPIYPQGEGEQKQVKGRRGESALKASWHDRVCIAVILPSNVIFPQKR